MKFAYDVCLQSHWSKQIGVVSRWLFLFLTVFKYRYIIIMAATFYTMYIIGNIDRGGDRRIADQNSAVLIILRHAS